LLVNKLQSKSAEERPTVSRGGFLHRDFNTCGKAVAVLNGFGSEKASPEQTEAITRDLREQGPQALAAGADLTAKNDLC
jgi:hypothetical protein